MKKFLGYQVADFSGENIQGEPIDPSGYASFEIMSKETAEQFSINNPGFLLMPIYEGTIEGYEIV